MLTFRDAVPSDVPFLAECIMAGFHISDFDKLLSDDLSDILESITECETREDTLYSSSKTRVAEIDEKQAGALLSYPGEYYMELRDKTFRQYWPGFFTEYPDSDPETDPGKYYLDSLAVHPDYRKQGIGRALLEDGIEKGLRLGFKKVTLVADAGYPHLIKLYESIGFVPTDHRHVFGTDFLRMVYTKPE